MAGTYLRKHLRLHDTIDASSPRGSFILQAGERPVVLLSAGIGATPVLAMLSAMSVAQAKRQVWWLHSARDGEHDPFAAEVRRFMLALGQGAVSSVIAGPARTTDSARISMRPVACPGPRWMRLGLPRDADVYLCGPNRFMADMKEILAALGFPPGQVHVEIFNGSESMMPGIIGSAPRSPHLPANDGATGALVSFARSGIAAHWNPSAYRSILELAEACDVPVRWSCRAGVCHSCESGLVSGSIALTPEPPGPACRGQRSRLLFAAHGRCRRRPVSRARSFAKKGPLKPSNPPLDTPQRSLKSSGP